jgi:hypothetical protein
LVEKTVWPCFYIILLVAWRSKVGKLLDAVIGAIPQITAIDVLGIKIRLVKPEEVRSVRGVGVSERISELPEQRSVARQKVREGITRFQ